MPTLAVIEAATGDVLALLDAGQSPGSAVEANTAGLWAFIYVTDAEPDDLWEYVEALHHENPDEPVIRRRKQSLPIAGLPKLGSRTFSRYRQFGDSKAYEVTRAQVDSFVTHHTS